MKEEKEEQIEKPEQQDRSLVAAAAGVFTVKWFLQTVAAWAFSTWLTKQWHKWKKKKEEKKDGRK